MSVKILVSIVTYNSGPYLRTCLESLQRQTCRDFNISVFDNASQDSTREIIREYRHHLCSVHFSDQNLGFSAAHNRIIASSSEEYVLVLNPDVVLESRFLEILTGEMEHTPEAGAASGKLFRWIRSDIAGDDPPAVSETTALDSTGIYFTRNQRHFDRGSGEIDTGQYNRKEYIFGASGAAAFYRRSMLTDIRIGKEYFDESFFAYREDADLAWRSQWAGWRCLYVPAAVAFHERKVFPTGRASVPAAINMHSFKNRFLMRIKNMDSGTCLRNCLPIAVRDILAIGYVILWEWTSLPGISLLLKSLPKALSDRRQLKQRRRIQPHEIRKWFTGQKSEPL